MQTSQIYVPEIGTNGSSKSLISRASASMATYPGCGSCQAGTSTDHEGSYTNMADCEGRDFNNQIWIPAVYRNREVSPSDADLPDDSEDSYSDGSETSIDDYYEHQENTCPDQARMNINSNGKRTRDGPSSGDELITEPENSNKKCQVNQHEIVPTPFQLVGLSLSTSGMQLYMMVNSDDKEKSLTPDKPATGIKEGKKSTASMATSQCEDAADLNMNTSCTNVTDAKDNLNTAAHNDSQRTASQPSRIRFHSVDESLQTEVCSVLPMEQSSGGTPVNNSVEMKQPCPCRLKSSKKRSYDQSCCSEAQQMLSGPSWQFDGDEINASNNKDTLQVSSGFCRGKTKTKTPHNDAHATKAKEFQPVQGRITHDSNMADGKKINNRIKADRTIMTDKRLMTDGRIMTDNRPMTDGRIMTDNRPMTDGRIMTDKRPMTDGRIMTHKKPMTDSRIMTDKRPMTDGKTMTDNRKMTAGKTTDNRMMTDGKTMTDNKILTDDKTTTEHATSSKTYINNNLHNTSSVDPAALAQFTEYTEDMRRKIKQNYKDLSSMMKSFSDVVQERNNNNQTSQSSSVSTQLEKTDKDIGRCSLM